VLGIGGGGDVVGALASAILCRDRGLPAVVGGVTWERLPVDPLPGPRRVDEISGAEPLADAVLLAGPETRTAGGALFAESQMSRFLGERTLLVDINQGPAVVAESLERGAEVLGADLMILVDVGGDVLGDGSEPGLASPLCDAVMLAAGVLLQRRGMRVVGAVFGPGCDGELTIEDISAAAAQMKLKDGAAAKRAFKEVIRIAPDSEIGQLSREYLEQLK